MSIHESMPGVMEELLKGTDIKFNRVEDRYYLDNGDGKALDTASLFKLLASDIQDMRDMDYDKNFALDRMDITNPDLLKRYGALMKNRYAPLARNLKKVDQYLDFGQTIQLLGIFHDSLQLSHEDYAKALVRQGKRHPFMVALMGLTQTLQQGIEKQSDWAIKMSLEGALKVLRESDPASADLLEKDYFIKDLHSLIHTESWEKYPKMMALGSRLFTHNDNNVFSHFLFKSALLFAEMDGEKISAKNSLSTIDNLFTAEQRKILALVNPVKEYFMPIPDLSTPPWQLSLMMY